MKKKALAMLMAICTMAVGMSANVSAEEGSADKLVVALKLMELLRQTCLRFRIK